MRKIALSYRRADSSAIAGRIQEHLANHFGTDDVFMDIDAIPFGEDFRDYIDEALQHTVAMVLVIGPKWLGTKRRGAYRIQDVTDPVRIEVETAIRLGIRIVPVLVEEATMPQPSDLPESLAKLPFINAATVDSGRDFRIHMERVIRALEVVLERAGAGAPAALELVSVATQPPPELVVHRSPEPVSITPAAPVAPVAPNRTEIAQRVTGAWWVSLVRGLMLIGAGVVQVAFPVAFHHAGAAAVLSTDVGLLQAVALIFMIVATKGVGLARIVFAFELLFSLLGTVTQTILGVGPALLLTIGRAAAEICAGAALGRYVRAEYARVVVGVVQFVLTALIVVILAFAPSSNGRVFAGATAAFGSGIAFVALGLILRSARNRPAR